jgi:hypothetical protein
MLVLKRRFGFILLAADGERRLPCGNPSHGGNMRMEIGECYLVF